MTADTSTIAALWGAVILSGLYHGLSPGMGWPLAVSAALMERRHAALLPALIALAIGHLIAMLAILLPFSLMASLVIWEVEIRLAAGGLLVLLGAYLFISNKHPRFLARVKPTKLVLWSFLIATAHGAGLMLLPIYLGICRVTDLDTGHQAAFTLMSANLSAALMVATAHTLAMSAAGALLAAAIYFWLGLKFLTTGWLNLDRLWAASLFLVGIVSIYMTLDGH